MYIYGADTMDYTDYKRLFAHCTHIPYRTKPAHSLIRWNKANNPLCFGRAPCFAVTCYRERQHIRATITVIRTSTR